MQSVASDKERSEYTFVATAHNPNVADPRGRFVIVQGSALMACSARPTCIFRLSTSKIVPSCRAPYQHNRRARRAALVRSIFLRATYQLIWFFRRRARISLRAPLLRYQIEL